MDLKNTKFGALTRTRTANLLITNQLLYQLSYEGFIVYLPEKKKKSTNLECEIILNS